MAILVLIPETPDPYIYDSKCGIPEFLDRAYSRELLDIPVEERCCHLRHFRLLKPEATKRMHEYPLVVFLHGAGARGWDNCQQLRSLPQRFLESSWRKRYPCYVLAPQCPQPLAWPYQAEGPDRQIIDPTADVMAMVDQVIQNHAIDVSRIYVIGISMGGYGTWTIASKYPDRFAAVIPICGGGDPEQAYRLVGLPLWAIHGDQDRTVPVTESQEMINSIRKAGGQPNYTELSGVGHAAWPVVNTDDSPMIAWMFQQSQK